MQRWYLDHHALRHRLRKMAQAAEARAQTNHRWDTKLSAKSRAEAYRHVLEILEKFEVRTTSTRQYRNET